jgi:hypothetical protein
MQNQVKDLGQGLPRTLRQPRCRLTAVACRYVERDPPAAEARFHFFSQLAFRAALSDKARQLSG